MSRPTTLPPRWAALATAYGGVGALAAALGVSARSLGRWGAGEWPVPGPVALAVAALARRKRLISPCKETP